MSWTVPLGRWFVSTSILAGLLFLCAGTTGVPMLRAYTVIFAGAGLVPAVLSSPTLDRERRKPGPEEIHRDSRRAATVLFLTTVVVAALDAGRFRWTTLSGSTQILALAVLTLAATLQIWAMTPNPFFSTAIRIQPERSHELIARGPYRFIRHPGYLAMTIILPATALALGSLVALVPALIYSAMIVFRLQREDGFLTENLGSYAEYAESVRKCPTCESTALRKLSLIYADGLSDLNARSRGWGLLIVSGGADLSFGKFKTRGEIQTKLSQSVSPPRKWSYWKILFSGFIGLLILEFMLGYVDTFLRVGGNFNQQLAWFGYAWLGSVAFVLCVSFRHNVWTVPKRRRIWNRSFMCRRCGHILELSETRESTRQVLSRQVEPQERC